MKTIKIKTKKQDNGIWGTPINCTRYDNFILFDEKLELLRTAIIIAFDELYNQSFEIIFPTLSGFWFIYMIDGIKPIKYDDYKVIDDILYIFENENDKIIYHRKNKLKQLYDN